MALLYAGFMEIGSSGLKKATLRPSEIDPKNFSSIGEGILEINDDKESEIVLLYWTDILIQT